MQRAVSVPNTDDPNALVDFAVELEADGWDGFFIWDHVHRLGDDALDVLDPWVVLGAVARATDRLRLGAMVTPLSRRRPWKVAKELVTLDHLSGGRAVLGVGLGTPAEHEFAAFGEVTSLRERAARTDEALEIIDRILRGEPVEHEGEHFEVHAHLQPAAIQSPRLPIWTAATPPHTKPLERAQRWDGVFCNVQIETDYLPLGPEDLRAYLGELTDRPDFDVVAMRRPKRRPEEYEEMGVTWLVEGSFPGPGWLDELRRRLANERS